LNCLAAVCCVIEFINVVADSTLLALIVMRRMVFAEEQQSTNEQSFLRFISKMKTLHSIVAIASFIAVGLVVAPEVASAEEIVGSGQVVSVRTCSDGSGGNKVVIQLRFAGVSSSSSLPMYLGVDAAGSMGLTSVATTALLSGRTVEVRAAQIAVKHCGVNAYQADLNNYGITSIS
jgi:hypothetical protein